MVIKNVNKKLIDNTFVITKEVEETLNVSDLQQRKQNLIYQLQNIRQQIKQLKSQYDIYSADLLDVENMIEQLSETEILDIIE
jgi:chromosome segregation ATPase